MVKVELLDADLPGDSVVHAAVVNLDREVAALIESGLVCVSCVVCRVLMMMFILFVSVLSISLAFYFTQTHPN